MRDAGKAGPAKDLWHCVLLSVKEERPSVSNLRFHHGNLGNEEQVNSKTRLGNNKN